ncbi:alpha/beta hydrolase fold [Opitutus terrae PB90-1]|uniref:Alpha/beta hydrolase fold n=2 Tax=Opitutus terrae TaxID=107709 RepID=B1ZNP3_OPITP|nr:alpha/beta hydrolase fold [Opitutus terrae PB90-1]
MIPQRLLVFALCTLPIAAVGWASSAPLNALASLRFIEVEPAVKLEVVDWGGNGPPLIFLHGWGCDAHVFDSFAPRFTSRCHVYGITRRGAGKSSAPASGYGDERFGRDILTIIDALHLSAPVLVGHSMAGAEMSWLNTHHREKFAGFIYLDAAGPSAFYSELTGDTGHVPFLVGDMRRQLDRLIPGSSELHPKQAAHEIIAALPRLQTALTDWLESMKDFPEPTAEQLRSAPPYLRELSLSLQKYTTLRGPILAIFAVPAETARPPNQPTNVEPVPGSLSQWDAFARGVPSARVVLIPGASHFVFQSHATDVLHAMNAFLDGLN